MIIKFVYEVLTHLFTIRTYSGRSGRVWPNTRCEFGV